MPRIDHAAVESPDPARVAAFYFDDPDGRRLEAITYRGGDDARRR